MKFFNKILAKADLALIKRSRITKAEKKASRLTNTESELQKANAELQVRKLSFSQRINSIHCKYIQGFPQHEARIALIIQEKDLSEINKLIESYTTCTLEKILLTDLNDNSPKDIAIQDKLGNRNIPVVSLSNINKFVDLEFVIFQAEFNLEYYKTICDKLELYRVNAIYVFPAVPLQALDYLPYYYTTWQKQLNELHNRLSDTQSKNILASFVKVKTTGNLGYCLLSNYPAYFHPDLNLKKNDIILNLESDFNLDLNKEYAERIGQEGELYLFEQDQLQNVEGIKRLNNTSVRFLPQTTFTNKKEITLDKIIQNNNINKIDFIRLNLNGSERFCLEGAVSTLRENKPKLAICVSHNPEDVLNISAFIQQLNLGYKFYLGQHSIYSNTVLYATVGS